MHDGSDFYDIFFIYHPQDIDITRRLADQLASQGLVCFFDEEFGSSASSAQALREALLRSHKIAFVVSNVSATSQLCNELVEFALSSGKLFLSVIAEQLISVDAHPAIAANSYLHFDDEQDFEVNFAELLRLLQVDGHTRLHTRLLVGARQWQAAERGQEWLLSQEEAEGARRWLTAGAYLLPKPSPLMVEFIHASRQRKPTARRGLPAHVALGIFAVLIIAAVIGIVQNVLFQQSAATATAVFQATRAEELRLAQSAAASATAESDDAHQLISRLAATSARMREVVLATAALEARAATRQAALTATRRAATAAQAAQLRATEAARIQRETAAQAVIDGAQRALAAGERDLAVALAWEAAQRHENPAPALRILRQALKGSPVATIHNIARSQLHPNGVHLAVLPENEHRILVYKLPSGQLDYAIDDHASEISALAYSGDGQFLISAGQDGEVVMRASADGAPIHRLPGHSGPLLSMAAFREEQKLVTAGGDGLALWDLMTGEKLAEYRPETENGQQINKLLLSAADARLLVWWGAGEQEYMTQHSSQTLLALPAESGEPVYLGYDQRGAIAYSGGRSLPAYAGDPNTGDLTLWHAASGDILTRLSDGFNWSLISGGNIASATDSLQFITFGDSAALLGIQNSLGEKRIARIDLADGTIIGEYADVFAAGLQSAHLLDERTVLSLTSDQRLVTWSTLDGGMTRLVGLSPQPLTRIEVAAAGALALGYARDGSAYVWNLAPAAHDRIRPLAASAGLRSMALNQAGDALFIQDSAGTRLRRIATGEALFQSDGRPARMNERGSHFALASDRTLQIVDAANGKIRASWNLDAGAVTALHLSPNADALLVETAADELLLLRTALGTKQGTEQGTEQETEQAEPLRLNTGDFGRPVMVSFAADSSALLSLHRAGALLWRGDGAEPAAAFALGAAPEYATAERFKVAFSADGQRLFFFVLLEGGLAGLTAVDLETGAIQRQAFVDVAYGELAAQGELLLLARGDGSVQALDTSNGAILHEFAAADDGDNITDFALLEERDRLYAAAENALLIWDLSAMSLLERVELPDGIARFSLSQNGQQALSQDASGAYQIIRVESAEELLERARQRLAPRDLSCAEREQYLALPFCDN